MNQELVKDFITTSRKLKKLMFEMPNIDIADDTPTALQYYALQFIDENKELAIGTLGKELMISSGGVAQLVERLTNKDWITKSADPNDKRISILNLSPLGLMELNKIKDMHQTALNKMLQYIEEDDLKAMIKIQKKILYNIQKNKTTYA